MKLTMNLDNLVIVTEMVEQPTEDQRQIWNTKIEAENLLIV